MSLPVDDNVDPLRTNLRQVFGHAMFIASHEGASVEDPAPTMFRDFFLPGSVRTAVLRITSLGVFRAHLNGRRIGADELSPGWTDYRKRLTWSEYDVAELLRAGQNRCEVLLGNGWYRGRLGRPARQDLYGKDLALIARLTIVLDDLSEIEIVTDDRWGWCQSSLVKNDLYDGTVQDLRAREDCSVKGVHPVPVEVALERRIAPPVRVLEEIPAEIMGSPDGRAVVDVGRNVVGWLRVRIAAGDAERHVVVRHAEVLENGHLAVRPLRDAAATDDYLVPHRGGETVLEPIHTFHGFRYAQISGVPASEILDVSAIVIGSDLDEIGAWSSSDPLLNRLHDNIRNSARGNFVSIPTDCPQRDERLGWTADIQVFSPVANYLFNMKDFLISWLDDMSVSQSADGSIPVVVPDIYRRDSVATAGWGDAAVIVPWELYQETGDVGILHRYWTTARRWVARVDAAVDENGIWVDGHQYGDWLDPNAPPNRPAQAMTDPTLVATAYRARVLEIMHRWSLAIGDDEAAAELAAAAVHAQARFQDRFVTRRGFLTSESQAAYAIAIMFDLLDDGQRAQAGARLADLVRVTDFTVGTGFLGTPLLLSALSSTGHHHVAMRILRGERSPSWLYAVTQGATTVWERWDSMLPDGTVNPGEMTSFNHYAFGAVASWMHEELAGLRRDAPGWRSATITVPRWSDLSEVSTHHDGPAGRWSVHWSRSHAGALQLDVEVPVGASATLRDGTGETRLSPGRHVIRLGASGESGDRGPTLREFMDDEPSWSRVIDRVREIRPAWTRRDIADEALPYLNLPLSEFARIVGMSVPTAEERALRSALDQLLD